MDTPLFISQSCVHTEDVIMLDTRYTNSLVCSRRARKICTPVAYPGDLMSREQNLVSRAYWFYQVPCVSSPSREGS